MDVLEAIRTRRSVRKFKQVQIQEKDLREILAAAQQAPSAGNRQPWRFVVVRDQDTKRRLASAANNQAWMGDAGAIVAALAMPKDSPEVSPKWAERDVMTAVEHIVLASWSLGYGSCWVGAFDESKVKDLLNIPENMTVMILLPIGVPDQRPEARSRKAISEIFSHEKYGQPLII